MTKKNPRRIVSAIGIMVFFIFFLWASNEEYKEIIIHSMPNAAYTAICNHLGDDCTTSKIITEYMSNRSYYDSLSY